MWLLETKTASKNKINTKSATEQQSLQIWYKKGVTEGRTLSKGTKLYHLGTNMHLLWAYYFTIIIFFSLEAQISSDKIH